MRSNFLFSEISRNEETIKQKVMERIWNKHEKKHFQDI